MTIHSEGGTKTHLWVVEASLDVASQLINISSDPSHFLYLNFGNDKPDGFVQMRPIDYERANNSVWWSQKEPIEYKCRALVRAQGELFALMRGAELYEHVADRLTLFTGYPVRVLSIGCIYNEDELKDCIKGTVIEYSCTTGGDKVFKTKPPKNMNHPNLLMPPQSALESIRWFRHGMMAARHIDQYLFYYIALESIARHVPGVIRGPKRDPKGNEIEGLESQEIAAINHLLTRHKNIPADARQELARVRARIAHGNTMDIQTLAFARDNINLVQRLAADGIALVYGINPDDLNVLSPFPIEALAPIMKAPYSIEHDPRAEWDGILLSDAFSTFLEKAKGSISP